MIKIRKLHKHQQRVAQAVICLTALCATGCTQDGNAPDRNESLYQDFDRYIAEYRETTRRLTLPPGTSWGTEPTKPPEPMLYAQGAGSTKAELHWFCSWEKEWISTAGSGPDEARHRVALEQLEKVKELQVYQVALDPAGRALIDKGLEEARRGVATTITSDVAANCV
ncbi:hypothetical protein OG994_01405 [Micromonospora globbae]|jgi:hypothetical protein|uniref:Lipoprotein n=1 Tax=Micromonospora globbae TaxID=1894969 RepID=A0ABZ1SA66_9ACTN|nr:hypothetical protein [Micromonospora globbae]